MLRFWCNLQPPKQFTLYPGHESIEHIFLFGSIVVFTSQKATELLALISPATALGNGGQSPSWENQKSETIFHVSIMHM